MAKDDYDKEIEDLNRDVSDLQRITDSNKAKLDALEVKLKNVDDNVTFNTKESEIDIADIKNKIKNLSTEYNEKQVAVTKHIEQMEKNLQEDLDEVIKSEKELREQINHQLGEIFTSFILGIAVYVIQRLIG